MKKYTFIMSAGFFILLFISACTISSVSQFFSDTETVTFSLPHSSKSYSSYFYADENNCRQCNTINSFFIDFEVNKNLPFPVVVSNKNNCASISQCAGAIYPFSTNLQEQDSFAAELLLSMYSCSTNSNASSLQVRECLSYFNWQKFMEECRNVEDPGKLDKELIMKKIAAGTFTKNDLKVK